MPYISYPNSSMIRAPSLRRRRRVRAYKILSYIFFARKTLSIMETIIRERRLMYMWLLNVVGGTAVSLFVIVVGIRGLKIIFKVAKTGLNRIDDWLEEKIKG